MVFAPLQEDALQEVALVDGAVAQVLAPKGAVFAGAVRHAYREIHGVEPAAEEIIIAQALRYGSAISGIRYRISGIFFLSFFASFFRSFFVDNFFVCHYAPLLELTAPPRRVYGLMQ